MGTVRKKRIDLNTERQTRAKPVKRTTPKETKAAPKPARSTQVVTIRIYNVYTGDWVVADVDFAAPDGITAYSIPGGFEEKKRMMLNLYSSGCHLLSLAQAWCRVARKSALDNLEASGVSSIGAREQGVKQDQDYVDSSNAVDLLSNYLEKFLEWNIRLLQSSNANDREESKSY